MNIFTWILAGAVVGWISFSLLRFNLKRSFVFSLIIGIVGSLLGGAALSPLLETVPVSSGEINPFSIFTASATALAALTITDMVHKRFGV
jgi:uncharacterized membrane protein YeaQ/YmgE (transglycosylase-associated protein family)